MADRLSPETRSRIMRAIRSKDTKPEIALRKRLFAEGYRYRLHPRQLPGKPDIVFPARKKIILVNGCFWHQHSKATCPIRLTPSSNRKYWTQKFLRNRARDAENVRALRKLGWELLVVWECEIREDSDVLYGKVRRFLGAPGGES
jgi:DNA mismatch endonuclease (patch repair protein)